MHVTYIELEKANDTVKLAGMPYEEIKMHGVNGNSLVGVKSLTAESEYCVRVCR